MNKMSGRFQNRLRLLEDWELQSREWGKVLECFLATPGDVL